MAQLLNPPQAPERISQILPTVKCSNCNSPVPISELGEHVCSKPPPMPAFKPPMSPRSAASFLPQKYQNLVAPRSQTPQAQRPPRTPPPQTPLPAPPTVGTSARRSSPSSSQIPPLRPRVNSTASSVSSRSTATYTERSASSSRRTATPQPDNGKVAFPTHGEPSGPPRQPFPSSRPSPEPGRIRVPSTVSISTASSLTSPTSPTSDLSGPRSPIQGGPPPPGALASRARAPSNASLRPAPSHAFRQSAQSSPAPYVPHQPVPAPISALPSTSPRPRAVTNAGGPPAFQTGPDVIYSTGNRSPIPAAYDVRARVPSNASANSANSVNSIMQPPPPRMAFSPPNIEIDTKIGGEAGMAGVGRRGFAAAARAAMFANTTGPVPHLAGHYIGASMDLVQGMDGRRANAPRFLDIASAQNYAANTPPLSPNSGSSHSPRSPLSATLPSPSKDGRGSTTPTRPDIASSRTPSPSDQYNHDDQVSHTALEPPKSPTMTAAPSTPFRLPFFEKFKNKHAEIETPPLDAKEEDTSPLSPMSDSSYGGLAYADSDAEEDEDMPSGPVSAPAATSQYNGISDDAAVPQPQFKSATNRVRFPSLESKTNSIAGKSESNYSSSSPTPSPRLPMRSLSAASSAASAYALRSAAKSTGALDRTMDTLFEEDATSPTATSASSPAGFLLGDAQRDSMSKPPKLPMRSHTSPTMGSGRPDSRHAIVTAKRRERASKKNCVKCDKRIDDGRWIQMDGGSVLCDKCWKNMYLPKCRRCNLTIEKQAISSSDGQLKGKYHRHCFTCHTCQKPFPDKSFYVFDGKPFCDYHYHEANDSLCAATLCGQPIEGPCAVSHAGDKYHPEHFLCEHPRCSEKLVEYWEVEGRMFCEKHASANFEEDDDDNRATRRVTRFIDLAGMGSGLGSGGGDGNTGS